MCHWVHSVINARGSLIYILVSGYLGIYSCLSFDLCVCVLCNLVAK